MKKFISILGSTGSIGTQTLDVIRQYPDLFQIVGLSAGKNCDLVKKQMVEFLPEVVSVASKDAVKDLEVFVKEQGLSTVVLSESEGLNAVATHDRNEFLVVAIEGTRALDPTYLAISKGISIGLASKEILVAAGSIIMALARSHKVDIVPIDSEHAAIKQCLARVNEDMTQVKKIVLTASGGPFREYTPEQFKTITVEQALNHPNWSMGHKITIDSATMVNKGLEVIEAHHLFGSKFDDIEVVVHPQSIVHGMVMFKDGNIVSQMGPPDMRYPIQYALSYPDLLDYKWPELDLFSMNSLEFSEPNLTNFPLLKLAYDVGREGGAYPIVFNAANEIAVQLFLDGKLSFLEISTFIQRSLELIGSDPVETISDIMTLDQSIREKLRFDYA